MVHYLCCSLYDPSAIHPLSNPSMISRPPEHIFRYEPLKGVITNLMHDDWMVEKVRSVPL